MAKAAFNKRKIFFASNLGLNLRRKLVQCCTRSIALCGAEIGTLRTVDQKRQRNFKMWFGRRMEKIGWTDHVQSEEAERDILHTVK